MLNPSLYYCLNTKKKKIQPYQRECIFLEESVLIVCTLTGEQVVIVLPQFDGPLIQLPGTFPGLRTQSGPHVLHTLLIIWI